MVFLYCCWLLQAKRFLDRIHEPVTKVLLLPVHWQDGLIRAEVNLEVAAGLGAEGAPLTGKPSLKLLAGHNASMQHFCCRVRQGEIRRQ